MRGDNFLKALGFVIILFLISGCISPGDGETAPPVKTTRPPISGTTKTPPSQVTTTTITSSPTPTPKETSKLVINLKDTQGNPLNGIALFEKGAVHSNRFAYGTMVQNGKGVIVLPKVRDIPRSDWNYWGLHVYSSNYIYFPKEIRVEPGNDSNIYDISLAPDNTPENDPVISDIKFEKIGDTTKISMEVTSPLGILGPQNLAFNSKTGEAFAMDPPTPVEDLSDDFPNGVYTVIYPSADTDPEDWYFIVADHACSNGPLQGYPVNENILPARESGSVPATTQPPTGSAIEIGRQLAIANGCEGCHYFDRESTFEGKSEKVNWKIGPGLKGLFSKETLPASGRAATQENVKNQIIQGGNGMPSFPNLSEEEISNIIAYLSSI